ncbi:MAG: hypothetical protein HY343_02420, partial [Lentisphaerae bacterium]|nr:hypothetical protein [Lentisphaerota bacterium]
PAEALQSGHGGMDYFPVAAFVDSVLNDTPSAMDIYTAVETAAPAIIASQSIEKGSVCLDVPDFRPNARRKAGQMPAGKKGK